MLILRGIQAQAQAHILANTCSESLRDLAAELEWSKPESIWTDEPTVRLITSKTVSMVPSGTLERFHLLGRYRDKWSSTFASAPDALQGDARLLIALLGEQGTTLAADKGFGLRMLNSRKLLVPTVEVLNARIDRLNQILPSDRQIGIKFYSADGKVDRFEFLRRFALEGMLPISETSGELLIHDFSYHVPSLLAPPELIRSWRLKVRLAIDLFDYIKSKNPSDRGYELIEEKILSQVSKSLDYANGNFGRSLSSPGSSFYSSFRYMDPELTSEKYLIEILKNFAYPADEMQRSGLFLQEILGHYTEFKKLQANLKQQERPSKERTYSSDEMQKMSRTRPLEIIAAIEKLD